MISVLRRSQSIAITNRLLVHVKPHWRRLVTAMVCMTGIAATTSAGAYIVKPVLDDVFVNRRMDMLQFLALTVLGLFVVKGFCICGNHYYMNYVGQKIIAQLRQQLYDHIQTLSLSFFDRTPTGVLMSRITNDVALVQAAVSDALTGLLKDSFSVVGLLGVLFYRDWQLATITIFILPFAFYPIYRFGRMMRRGSTQSQESMGDISVILHETITGNRIVKAFGMEQYEMQRFAGANAGYFKHIMKQVQAKAISSPIMEFFGGVGIVFTIWYGGYCVIKGTSTPGSFFSFMAALLLLYEPIKRLNNVNSTLQQGLAAAQRVYEVLDTRPEIRDRREAVLLPPISEDIELRRVRFRYGEKWVLQDISLNVPVGKVVALVGVSGSGKTTLVNLIPRFYEVTEGEVLIDGTDIRQVTLASLRSQIGMVTQQTILFNDTVRNNIAYGDIDTRRNENDVIAAAKAANAYDFIMRLPQGLDTVIGEQGVRLSGGERQRLCIARAILKNAPILILDEATSSLDSEAELEVQRALENLMAGRTTLVIAHRLSTIKNADRIVVLAGGRIVEEGRHDELLARGYEYRRLYELQFANVDPREAA